MPDGKRSLSPADQLKEAVWRQIVQLARVDPVFRERLQADPLGVLASAELDAPADISFVFIEADDESADAVAARSAGSVIFIPIGAAEHGELGEDALLDVVGGTGGRISGLLDMPRMPPSFATSISLSGESGGTLSPSPNRRRH